jgi:hypothetical protein
MLYVSNFSLIPLQFSRFRSAFASTPVSMMVVCRNSARSRTWPERNRRERPLEAIVFAHRRYRIAKRKRASLERGRLRRPAATTALPGQPMIPNRCSLVFLPWLASSIDHFGLIDDLPYPGHPKTSEAYFRQHPSTQTKEDTRNRRKIKYLDLIDRLPLSRAVR